MSNVYVYAHRNIENGMMNIGYKSADGKDKLTYITSLNDDAFWEDYSKGLMEESLLFVGDESDDDLAQTIEWFALKYGIATNPDKFYLKKNNAHCVNEAKLTAEHKNVIVEYIEGGRGLTVTDTSIDDKNLVNQISDNINKKLYQIIEVDIKEVYVYGRNQVRTNQYDQAHVSQIRIRLMEDPAQARKTFTPIIVVVSVDGSFSVLDGNNRLEAAKKTRGWNTVPVIYLNESEFGYSAEIRKNNYDLFGLLQNKKSFEIKKPNTKEDLKRNIINYIVAKEFDLSKPMHIEHARKMIYDRFSLVCESKSQLNGILVSILKDYEKNQNELKYQKELLVYDEAFFTRYLWGKYHRHDIATVHTTHSNARHGQAIGYVLRRMKNINASKGAIVIYFSSKQELVNEEQEKWIEDTKQTISHHNLPITVDVLPAFNE